MTVIDKVKNRIGSINPVARYRRCKMRAQLRNQNITFLSPNCIGGILFHDLGLKFMSPTVNLMMTQTDFVKFVLNLDNCLVKDFCFFKHPEYVFPCATLGDITVYITHYTSEKEAFENGIRE